MKPSLLRKLLSFLIPVTKKANSAFSPNAEVNLINGKRTLDTPNANYSYGSLQRILKRGLKEVDLTEVESILLLGVAGGSVISTLRADLSYDKRIKGIEIDPDMLKIAAREFGIRSNEKTELICADACSFVRSDNGTYDLLIVDLFIDNMIPLDVYDLTFWDDLCDSASIHSTILFNTINETVGDVVSIVLHMQNSGWKMMRLKQVEGTNDLYLFMR